MAATPKTITQTLYICAMRVGTEYTYTVLLIDPTKGANTAGCVVLGTKVVTLDIPDGDPEQLHIAALEAKKKAILGAACDQADGIEKKIALIRNGDPDYFLEF